VIFRRIANPGRKLTAYGLFASSPGTCSLLEDPSGNGRAFVTSYRGSSLAIMDPSQDPGGFVDDLRTALAGREASPAIRCLIYAAYEAGNLFERLPLPAGTIPGPVLWAQFPAWSACFEGETIYLAAQRAEDLDELTDLLHQRCESGPGDIHAKPEQIRVTSGKKYMKSVERVREYIAAGDIFQANIARFWEMAFSPQDLPALYRRLRQVNPAPFAGIVRIGDGDDALHILSASPERLFRISTDGIVETRPIAGTRRRGEGARDDSLSAELLLSEKERAEHIMLVDLERNDLGRVCVPGSVHVDERMVIERYATVQHIVSNVRGRLASGLDVLDVLAAMFPGGTITGCPKIRCMEIIHELERRPRGPYTGGIGYVAWDGSADMNILIRSFWHHRGVLSWAAGAGIVADSNPEHELKETEHKAEGMLRALRAENKHEFVLKKLTK